MKTSADNNKEYITKYKIIYTIIIIVVYLVGKCIPLYNIDITLNIKDDINVQTLLFNSISGDINQVSIFAIGLSPYLLASMVVQMIVAIRKTGSKKKISPGKINKTVIVATLIVSVIQACIRVSNINYSVNGKQLMFNKAIVLLQLVTGVMMIMWLAARNKKYGIGGPTLFILVNIVDGIINTLRGNKLTNLVIPLAISLVVVVVMIIMENTEKRIPVQRISIHNIYADKNYLAIKLNPIGIMPIMFSTAFYMFPQLIFAALGAKFNNVELLEKISRNLNLSSIYGIIAFIVMLYVITIIFSVVFINPGDLTEQLLKNGDSLLDIHAGRDTKKYLTGVVLRISFFSATIMSICVATPMILQIKGDIASNFVMLPSSVMMLTGIWCNLYQEYIAIKDYEAYEPFI